MKSSHRTRSAIAVAGVSLVALTGCISNPSAQRVALDIIDSLDEPESVKDCMRDRIDEYSKDELQAIADAAAADTAEAGPTSADLELAEIEADLTACRTGSDN